MDKIIILKTSKVKIDYNKGRLVTIFTKNKTYSVQLIHYFSEETLNTSIKQLKDFSDTPEDPIYLIEYVNNFTVWKYYAMITGIGHIDFEINNHLGEI